MKKIISVIMIIALLFQCCSAESAFSEEDTFKKMSDPGLLDYMEENIYQEMLGTLDSDAYFVEKVSAVYISDEYLEELAFNTKSNIYFGFTLSELEQQFQGKRYVFTLSDTMETTVEAWEAYDDTMEKVIRNVAVGTGVILICVTVSLITGAAGAPAVSMIFAVAAKTGTQCALSGGLSGAVASGTVEYISTGDPDAALKAAALGGSNAYKWGAIVGSISGGVAETAGLMGAGMNGLTMNEAALIQKESKLPLAFIKNFHSMDEYELYKNAGLVCNKVGGAYAYTQTIDLKTMITDQYGKTMTNEARILNGYSPVDPTGIPYELHHIGQMPNSPLAILTKAEHMQGGNNLILHFRETSLVEHGAGWQTQVSEFWSNYLVQFGGV